jgi:hypothetical protein
MYRNHVVKKVFPCHVAEDLLEVVISIELDTFPVRRCYFENCNECTMFHVLRASHWRYQAQMRSSAQL